MEEKFLDSRRDWKLMLKQLESTTVHKSSKGHRDESRVVLSIENTTNCFNLPPTDFTPCYGEW